MCNYYCIANVTVRDHCSETDHSVRTDDLLCRGEQFNKARKGTQLKHFNAVGLS